MSEIKLCSDIIDKEDIDYLIDWLKGVPQLTKGKETIEFEKKFSNYFWTKKARAKSITRDLGNVKRTSVTGVNVSFLFVSFTS